MKQISWKDNKSGLISGRFEDTPVHSQIAIDYDDSGYWVSLVNQYMIQWESFISFETADEAKAYGLEMNQKHQIV